MTLNDGFGRNFKYLRLSVTDACNFHCSYCLPNGYRKCASRPPLSRNELRRAATAFSELGLEKIRLTGGEPSIRKDFDAILSDIAALQSVKQVALTTNGYRLEKRVETWRSLGLSTLNVSVDSLNRENFKRITGHDRLEEIMRGLDKALELGFESVKINTVYMKGLNDTEVNDFINLTKKWPISVRFIELMETGDHRDFFKKHHSNTDTIVSMLRTSGWSRRIRKATAGPAVEFSHNDHLGRVGVIAPYSKDFCKNCNRLRFSSTGNLHLCLFGSFGLPMHQYLQNDDQIKLFKEKLIQAVKYKTDGHHLASGETGMTANLSAIGG